MRKSLGVMLGIAMFVTVFTGAVVAAQSPHIGVVDISAILDESLAGKDANQSLDNLLATYQSDLDTLGDQIIALEEQLAGNADLADDDRGALEKQYEQLLDTYMGRRQQYEAGIQQGAQSLQSQLLQEIAYVLQVFGNKYGYDVILDAGTVFYFSTAIDITRDVIKMYDELYTEALAQAEQEGVPPVVEDVEEGTVTQQ